MLDHGFVPLIDVILARSEGNKSRGVLGLDPGTGRRSVFLSFRNGSKISADFIQHQRRITMKVRYYILPVLALATLASCNGNPSTPSSSVPAETSFSASSQVAPTFEAFTLSQLHDARVAKTLPSLKDKLVAVKGKVTFAKHVGEDDGVLAIQNGKYAVEVAYPDTYNVNVGDVVEVKGMFSEYAVGDVSTISISTYRSTVPSADIKVIDEAISVETVTITKDDELIEYDSSLSSIDFDVVGSRRNAAFIGKLAEGQAELIVANKLSVAERFPDDSFAVGDKVNYTGIFSYSGNDETKVLRYFDKDGFSKAN